VRSTCTVGRGGAPVLSRHGIRRLPESARGNWLSLARLLFGSAFVGDVRREVKAPRPTAS
jgi:hypothetical protein